MRFLTIFLLSFLILRCGPTSPPVQPAANAPTTEGTETPEQNEEEPDEAMTSRGLETSEVEESGETDQLATIRKEYARIQAALEAGSLHKDTFPYLCEDAMVEGMVALYSDNGDVVLVVNGFTQGSHSGVGEHYYFQDGQPVFLFRESGSWQFGGEMQTMDDGTEVPGTIDNMTEDRLYFHEGRTIKALTKEYEIKNGEDVDLSTIPNEAMAHNGELPDGLGLIQSIIATRTVDCQLMEEN